MEAMIHENERDPRALWSEWLAVPQMAIYTCASLSSMAAVLSNLEVFPERMLANLHMQRDMVASEWLLFRLAEKIGKTQAQETVRSLLAQTTSSKQPLTDLLRARPELVSVISDKDLSIVEMPERYTGHSGEIVDAVLASIGERDSQ
jgi:adenylosuccinate lyase/3-carboxy-cis,cis-muconate cycloisomerase